MIKTNYSNFGWVDSKILKDGDLLIQEVKR